VLPGPRIFGITALDADIVAVLRSGPSPWVHVGRWDVAGGRYEPGSWLRGRLYPQRCDLSPDGHYLCYFALLGHAKWAPGQTYIAVSRLPWLTALAAWGTSGTWSRGAHFVDDPSANGLGPPDAGDDAPLRRRHGLALTQPVSFAVERRRGWVETPDSQPGSGTDQWDEDRGERVRVGRPRPQPSGTATPTVSWLVAGGGFAAHRSFSGWYGAASYELRKGPAEPVHRLLDDVQWADWSRDGRLLVATTSGRLQIRDGASLAVTWEADLAAMRPTPEPPPASARTW
jgi:hypothetical protein